MFTHCFVSHLHGMVVNTVDWHGKNRVVTHHGSPAEQAPKPALISQHPSKNQLLCTATTSDNEITTDNSFFFK